MNKLKPALITIALAIVAIAIVFRVAPIRTAVVGQ
jgi:hypothetical protein